METLKLRRAAYLLETTESHLVQHLDGTPFRGKYRIERVGRDEHGWSLVQITDLWGRPVQLGEYGATDVHDLIDTLRAIVHTDPDSERAGQAMRAVAEDALRRNGAAPF